MDRNQSLVNGTRMEQGKLVRLAKIAAKQHARFGFVNSSVLEEIDHAKRKLEEAKYWASVTV